MRLRSLGLGLAAGFALSASACPGSFEPDPSIRGKLGTPGNLAQCAEPKDCEGLEGCEAGCDCSAEHYCVVPSEQEDDTPADSAPPDTVPADSTPPDSTPSAPPPSQTTCTSNADCKTIGLDSCNGKHQCIKGGEQGDACKDEKKDCRDGYYCCPIFSKCYERCSSKGQCPDTGKKCVDLFFNKLCI